MISDLETNLMALILECYSLDEIPLYKKRQINRYKSIIANLKRQRQKQLNNNSE